MISCTCRISSLRSIPSSTSEYSAAPGTAVSTGCLRNNNDQSAGCPTYADYSSYKENGSYIIILQIQNPKDHGFNYASDSGALYKGIIDTVLAN